MKPEGPSERLTYKGAPRYLGMCSKHGPTERYLNSGMCVQCKGLTVLDPNARAELIAS